MKNESLINELKLQNGIYSLDYNNNFTKEIEFFYNYKPFPNYKKSDNKLSINNIGNNNLITKKLKKEIGFNKNILEVGAGTCQLSIYFALGTNNRRWLDFRPSRDGDREYGQVVPLRLE